MIYYMYKCIALFARGQVNIRRTEIDHHDPAVRLPTPLRVVRVEREIGRARDFEHATAFDELLAGYAAGAAAVRDHDGRVIAAVGVGGATSRLTRERLAAVGEDVRGGG